MMGGLGLRVLRAGHVGHTRDGARGGARGWCKSRGLEVIRCNIRCKGKSRGKQGGEPGARGRIITQLHHQGEERVHLVIDYIWSFMAIHVDTFFQHHMLPSQLDEPLPSCPFQQVFHGWVPEHRKDLGVKSVLESLGGDLICYRLDKWLNCHAS
jgi:hypothetical protein